MDHRHHCDLLAPELERLAAAVEAADPGAAVPGCPDWNVADLAGHIGGVHRWAGHHVRTLSPKRISSSKLRIHVPDDPEQLPDWLRTGGAELLETLLAADPYAEMWAWGADQHARFWSRRMLHETAIHRADAESAAGATPEYAADFAADGIDELITGFGRRRKYQPGSTTDGVRLRVVATDTGDAWLIEARDGRLQPRRDADGSAEAGCTVSGPASGLYLYLWNRAAATPVGVTVTGDPRLLSAWQASVRVRWG
jgi:uncharacterized protein (TIGR03083 family)